MLIRWGIHDPHRLWIIIACKLRKRLLCYRSSHLQWALLEFTEANISLLTNLCLQLSLPFVIDRCLWSERPWSIHIWWAHYCLSLLISLSLEWRNRHELIASSSASNIFSNVRDLSLLKAPTSLKSLYLSFFLVKNLLNRLLLLRCMGNFIIEPLNLILI